MEPQLALITGKSRTHGALLGVRPDTFKCAATRMNAVSPINHPTPSIKWVIFAAGFIGFAYLLNSYLLRFDFT